MADARGQEQTELDRKTEMNLERAWIEICETEERKLSRGPESHAEPIQELCRRIVPRVYHSLQKKYIREKAIDPEVATEALEDPPNQKAGKSVAADLAKEEQQVSSPHDFQLGPKTGEGPCNAGEKATEAGRNGGRSETDATKIQDMEAGNLLDASAGERGTSEKTVSATTLSETSPDESLPANNENQGPDCEVGSERKVAIASRWPPTKKEGLRLQSGVSFITPISYSGHNIIQFRTDPGEVGHPRRTGDETKLRTSTRAPDISTYKLGPPSPVPLRTDNRLLMAYSYRVVEDALKMSQERSAPPNSPRVDKHLVTGARRPITTCGTTETSSLGRITTFVFKFFCCGYDAYRPRRARGKVQNKLEFQMPILDFKSRYTTACSL